MYRDRNKRSSRSRSRKRKRSRERNREPLKRDNNDLKHNHESRREYKRSNSTEKNQEVDLESSKPNFELSGRLAEETNTINGVIVNYNEPPESHKPDKKWRLYIFKGDEQIGKIINNLKIY